MPGTYLLVGIVDEQLELNGFDVALAGAHVALRGKVGLRGLVDDLALKMSRRRAS